MNTVVLGGRRSRRLGWLSYAVLAGVAVLASLAVQGVVAPPAQALCATQALQGDWHNTNPNTNAMTRAVVSFNCSDVRLCDINGVCTGGTSTFSTRVFGRCSPSDCDWGTRTATDMGGGWIRSIYSFGFKTSYVWLKTYDYYGLTYLRVWVHNDFTSADGRTDYTTDEWFLR
jgi:hypothetical protein